MSNPQRPLCAHEQPCIRCKRLRRCLELFIPSVVAYLRGRRIEEDVAIDAVSHAWEAALKWIADGRAWRMTSAQRKGYLCRTAYNIARNLVRRQRRSILGKAKSLGQLRRRDEPAVGMDPFDAVVSKEEAALVRQALDALEGDDRCLIELYYHDGATYAQLADLLRSNQTKAWRGVNRALDRLTDLLIEIRSKARKISRRRAS